MPRGNMAASIPGPDKGRVRVDVQEARKGNPEAERHLRYGLGERDRDQKYADVHGEDRPPLGLTPRRWGPICVRWKET